MIGLGILAPPLAAWILWATRKERVPAEAACSGCAIALPFLPLFANSFGWIFTEIGRQPWAVFGLMTTARPSHPGSASPRGSLAHRLTLVYRVLAVVEVRLMLTYIRRGADALPAPGPATATPWTDDRPLALAY